MIWTSPGIYITTNNEARIKNKANNALMRGSGDHPSFPFDAIIGDFLMNEIKCDAQSIRTFSAEGIQKQGLVMSFDLNL